MNKSYDYSFTYLFIYSSLFMKLFKLFFSLFLMFWVVSFSLADTQWDNSCSTQECRDNSAKLNWQNSKSKDECKPVKLNTNVPFIGNQIETCEKWDPNKTTIWNAFPRLMWWMSKLLITLILIVWFLMIVVWWVMITASWAYKDGKKWKELIMKVIIWIILLWMSWIILNVINPNFFK